MLSFNNFLQEAKELEEGVSKRLVRLRDLDAGVKFSSVEVGAVGIYLRTGEYGAVKGVRGVLCVQLSHGRRRGKIIPFAPGIEVIPIGRA